MYKFSKERMIKRIKEEGRVDMLTDDVIEIMDNLDGCEASNSCWRRTVFNEPVCWVIGKDGTGAYVNERDCIWG